MRNLLMSVPLILMSFSSLYGQTCNPDCDVALDNRIGCDVDLIFQYQCNPDQTVIVLDGTAGTYNLCVQNGDCPPECPKQFVFPGNPVSPTIPNSLGRYEYPGVQVQCTNGSYKCPNGFWVEITNTSIEFGCL